jgi:zinc D-Ala-D-Ala carboxypeptidase
MTPDGYMDAHDWAKCPFFRPEEFKCPCCGRDHVKFELIQALLVLRAKVKKPIHINSGFRCLKHNAEVGGTPESQHLIGAAADIFVGGVEVDAVAGAAASIRQFSNGGIGVYPPTRKRRGWVHVDVRNGRARWFG